MENVPVVSWKLLSNNIVWFAQSKNMELINKILNFPVIAQGALGSFLFWLAYQCISKLSSFIISSGKGGSLKWRKEILMYEQLSILQNLTDVNSPLKSTTFLLSIHASLNRFIQAVIYFVLGQAAEPFIGGLASLAYIFSIFYLFVALKATHFEISSDKDDETRKKRLEELNFKLNEINEKLQLTNTIKKEK